MRRTLGRLSLSVSLLASGVQTIAAQSVADIVEQMYEAYERQVQGIEDYTLIQVAMGVETMSYFKKEMVDGKPIFQMTDSDGGLTMSLGDEDVGVGDIYLFGPQLIEHARYVGLEQIEGTSVHLLAIDDASRIEFLSPSGPDEDTEYAPKSGRIYVDAERMVPRRMEFDGEATTNTGVYPMNMRIDLLDYRVTEGLLIPFHTVMSIEGMQAMMDPEMQAQLEEMEEELANMPESQRRMMEQMLGPQIEAMRQMMAGGGEAMTMEVTVSEVRVNAGPPR